MSADAASHLADTLRRAGTVAVLTGAGVSAESGIPTFRDAQTGLWARYAPQDLARPEAFAADPGRVWRWYQWRRQLVHEGGPNRAHTALAELQAALPDVRIVTQNVDGLHQAGGASGVIELHGNLWRLRCHRGCGHTHTLTEPEQADSPPACPACAAFLRPDVVWFGEMLPQHALTAAAAAVEAADVVLVVGTANLVYPAAALPEQALADGIPVAEINPEETPLTPRADLVLRQTAGAGLGALADKLAAPTQQT